MADLQQVLEAAVELNRSITQFLKHSTYTVNDGLNNLDMDCDDGEQLFLKDELLRIAIRLADVQEHISYLSLPVKEVSRLRKGTAGKYRTAKGHFYDCRSMIEALVTDDYHDVPYWTRSVVEYNGTDFYVVGHKDLPMKGLTVRVRGT